MSIRIWMLGSALSKWDRSTGKVSVFRIPTPTAVPYGATIDRNDNVYRGPWRVITQHEHFGALE